MRQCLAMLGVACGGATDASFSSLGVVATSRRAPGHHPSIKIALSGGRCDDALMHNSLANIMASGGFAERPTHQSDTRLPELGSVAFSGATWVSSVASLVSCAPAQRLWRALSVSLEVHRWMRYGSFYRYRCSGSVSHQCAPSRWPVTIASHKVAHMRSPAEEVIGYSGLEACGRQMQTMSGALVCGAASDSYSGRVRPNLVSEEGFGGTSRPSLQGAACRRRSCPLSHAFAAASHAPAVGAMVCKPCASELSVWELERECTLGVRQPIGFASAGGSSGILDAHFVLGGRLRCCFVDSGAMFVALRRASSCAPSRRCIVSEALVWLTVASASATDVRALARFSAPARFFAPCRDGLCSHPRVGRVQGLARELAYALFGLGQVVIRAVSLQERSLYAEPCCARFSLRIRMIQGSLVWSVGSMGRAAGYEHPFDLRGTMD